MEGFCVTVLGAYIWRGVFSEFYGSLVCLLCGQLTIRQQFSMVFTIELTSKCLQI